MSVMFAPRVVRGAAAEQLDRRIPTVTKHTTKPLCAVPDADGLCTVQGGGTLTVTGYEDPRATRHALEKRITALEAKA